MHEIRDTNKSVIITTMIFILVIIIINIILILEQYCINIVDRLPYMLKGAFPDHIRPRPPDWSCSASVEDTVGARSRCWLIPEEFQENLWTGFFLKLMPAGTGDTKSPRESDGCWPAETDARVSPTLCWLWHRLLFSRMEHSETEHRSDNEAEYEDEEVDPRIQVRGYSPKTRVLLIMRLHRSACSDSSGTLAS